jgi:hypothetical protein
MADRPQSFENHVRYVPGYHIVTFGILVINLLWRIYTDARHFSADHSVQLLLAVGLVLLFFYARLFALGNQDRIIRLEMHLRLARVLPPDLASQVDRFSVGQLISMRFASDAELPELARKVLSDNLTDRQAIKQLVKDWQADHLRV